MKNWSQKTLFTKVYRSRRIKAWIWTLTHFLITGIMLWEVSKCGTSKSLCQMVDLQWQVAHHFKHPVPVGCTQPLYLFWLCWNLPPWLQLWWSPSEQVLYHCLSIDLPGLAASDGVSFSLHSSKPPEAQSPLVKVFWSDHLIRTHTHNTKRDFGNQIYFVLNSFDAIQI